MLSKSRLGRLIIAKHVSYLRVVLVLLAVVVVPSPPVVDVVVVVICSLLQCDSVGRGCQQRPLMSKHVSSYTLLLYASVLRILFLIVFLKPARIVSHTHTHTLSICLGVCVCLGHL